MTLEEMVAQGERSTSRTGLFCTIKDQFTVTRFRVWLSKPWRCALYCHQRRLACASFYVDYQRKAPHLSLGGVGGLLLTGPLPFFLGQWAAGPRSSGSVPNSRLRNAVSYQEGKGCPVTKGNDPEVF